MDNGAKVKGNMTNEGLASDWTLGRDELERMEMFEGVALHSVWGLLEHCPVSTLALGDVLLRKGEPNETMYVVLSGRLQVHIDDPKEPPVAFLESGQTVGELSVLDGSTASAFVTAASTTRLLAVPEDVFWRLVGASHKFATNLLLLLAQRFRATNATISESARRQKQFEQDATVDALTGLNNRRWLDGRLDRIIDRHRRDGASLSIIMLDVDHFKRFNDDYGHLAGDEVLAAVGRTLLSSLRPTDLAVRYGGEEFLVILPGTDLEGADRAAQRLRAVVLSMKVVSSDGSPLPRVTVSLGVAALAEQGALSLIKRADDALYRAKRAGRNRVELAG